METIRVIVAFFVLLALGGIVNQQSEIISNQKAQMRQQFQSDGQALWGLLGDDGLAKIKSGSGDLSLKESFLVGSLINRVILMQKDIGVAYTSEEKERLLAECKGLMRSGVMQEKWAQVKSWYPIDRQAVIDACLPKQ